MSSGKPVQIFAGFASEQPQSMCIPQNSKEEKASKPSRLNEIQVTATGDLSLEPDKCKVIFSVTSAKDVVQEVKNSVSRRLDYITQTLNNHQVKGSDIQTSKILQNVDGLYHLYADVIATFHDFDKCQTVCNFLVEKLGDSIKLSAPEFSQDPQQLENLRRQTSLLAVRNAKQKATEIAHLLHSSVGKVLAIQEESSSEWEDVPKGSQDTETPLTIQQKKANATVRVNVQVSASFELKPREKSREIQK